MKKSSMMGPVFLSFAVAGLPSSAAAVSSDRPAAIVTFPDVVVDGARGVDTFLQIANRDSGAAVDVKCFLENANRHCDDNGVVCGESADCPASVCRQDFSAEEFRIRLTARQPFGWRASVGAPTLPLPGNQGSIPAAPEDPFRGALRCVAVDANGAPVDRNVLMGTATVERFESGSPAELDAARYNAVGFQALPGANNGDNELMLGGSLAEYEACPATVLMNHFFDFAVEPMTHSSEVFTDVILVPCGRDLFHEDPGGTIAQFFVNNEFEQRFSTSRTVTARQDGQISLIDTFDPTRSIFSAGIAGTLTGQTLIFNIGGGLLAVAVERHQRLGQPAGTAASAAFNLHSQGELAEADVLLVGEPPLCHATPASGCRGVGKTSLLVVDRDEDSRDDLALRLRQVEATTFAELGDPTSATRYGFCLYAGTAEALIAALEVGPSAAKWRALGSKGYKYKDRTGGEDGVERLVLRVSSRGRGRALLNAGGENLPTPAPPIPIPLAVQLVNDEGTCFEARYDAADLIRNEPGRFKARKN